jgi:hypothetical protein
LNREKGNWESSIIELGSPDYAKVRANMKDLKGNEVYVPSATGKGLGYRYFNATQFLPILKYFFNKSP